jgi:hypothetical protein
MRAQNQQDLIYKRGQAGITKASVTIVFDNSDKEKSPVALLDCKQITVTRQVGCRRCSSPPPLFYLPLLLITTLECFTLTTFMITTRIAC